MTAGRWELTREKYLTTELIERLTDYCVKAAEFDGSRNRRNMVTGWMMVHLGLSAGLRVSELANLRVADCRVGYGQSELVIRRGKGGHRGVILLGKSLKTHLKHYIAAKRSWEEATAPDDYLLVSKQNKPFTTRGLQRKYKGIAKRAGLPAYCSIHGLRHSFATTLLHETKNLRLVQKQMRHRNIGTTTVYADVADAEIQGAMDKIG